MRYITTGGGQAVQTQVESHDKGGGMFMTKRSQYFHVPTCTFVYNSSIALKLLPLPPLI